MKVKRGVVLCGGLGERLYPLTKITNKHLLPIYNKPMVFYPLEKLVEAGIGEILLVTGGNHAGEFLRLLGNGKSLGIKKLEYTYQEGEKGIADALRLAQDFARGEPIVVILGDNIFEASLTPYIKNYEKQESGARILLKETPEAHRFGVAEINEGKIIKITEKPKKPKTNLAVTGIYFYDSKVFEYLKRLKLSKRKEYEITDVNNYYIKDGNMEYDLLEGWWTDAGTFESYYRAITQVREGIKANGKINPY